MADTRQFSWSTMIWLWLFTLLIIVLLIPGSWIQRMVDEESSLVIDSMGYESAEWVRTQALAWYNQLVTEPGLDAAARQALLPTQQERVDLGANFNFWFEYVEGRIVTFFLLVFHFLSRVTLIAAWAPYLLIMLIPSVLDGIMTWKVRQTTFSYTSPIIHRYSIRAAILISTLFVMSIFVPFALSPVIIPIMMVLLATAFGLMTSSLPKRM